MKRILISVLLLALVFSVSGCFLFGGDPYSDLQMSGGSREYLSVGVQSMDELAAFINGTDPERLVDLVWPITPTKTAEVYEKGYYQSMIEAVKRNGFLLKPYYKGKLIELYDNRPDIKYKFVLEYEWGNEGAGYVFGAPVDGDFSGLITVYYLNEADAEDAKENPYRYLFGKKFERTLENVLKGGWQKKNIVIGGQETTAYLRPFGANSTDDREWMVFVYEEKFLVKIIFNAYKNEDKFGSLDFVKDLTFEMIPLKK